MAIEPYFGEFGDQVRGDCRVQVEFSSKLEIEFHSKVVAMYGRQIRQQIDAVLERFGNPSVSLTLHDAGALPYVIDARIEAALAHLLGAPIPPLPVIQRSLIRDRRRRTRLYVPGNTPKFFTNCALLQPDCVVFDLEDSVAQHGKMAARSLVRHALHHVDFRGAEASVRINSGATGLDDLMSIVHCGVEVIYVPKVEDPNTLCELSAILDQEGSQALLVPIIETAIGVEYCFDIVRASTRVVSVTLGYEDYVLELRATRTRNRSESRWAESRIINAARAAGIAPLASVYGDVYDLDQVATYTQRCFAMGYEGIGCIHPSQIAVVHRAMRPSEEFIETSRLIVKAFEESSFDGSGAIAVHGRMVDLPVYEQAKWILTQAGENL